MARLTKRQTDGSCGVEPGQEGAALERLARFEDLVDELAAGQVALAERMECLRADGRKNSVQFKELLAKKLTDGNMLMVFKARGLD